MVIYLEEYEVGPLPQTSYKKRCSIQTQCKSNQYILDGHLELHIQISGGKTISNKETQKWEGRYS